MIPSMSLLDRWPWPPRYGRELRLELVEVAAPGGQISHLPQPRVLDLNSQLCVLEVLAHRASFHLCSEPTKTAVVSAVVCVFFGPNIPHLFPLFPLKANSAERAKVFELLENFWSERRDLNSGPPVPQTGVLTGLRDSANEVNYRGSRVAPQSTAD
jgi:hypothetical protein